MLSEHRLDEVIPLATRVICMSNGRIDGSPKTVVANMWEVEKFRPFIPQIPRLFLVECERYSVYSARSTNETK